MKRANAKRKKSRIRIVPLDQIEQAENNGRIQQLEQSQPPPPAPPPEDVEKQSIKSINQDKKSAKSTPSKTVIETKSKTKPKEEQTEQKYEFSENEIFEELQGEEERSKEYDVNELQVAGGEFGDPERQKWGTEVDFLLSIIGFAVDVSNINRFPNLLVKHGGGLFLIPYTVMLIFCGIPLFYMELIIGQFVRQGCISVWKICPIFKGIGVCMCLVSFMTTFYYNVTLAWSVIYLYESCFSPLQWTLCGDNDQKLGDNDRYWATCNCTTPVGSETSQSGSGGGGIAIPTSAQEFFRGKILHMYEKENREGICGNASKEIIKHFTIENLGHPDDSLAVILLAVYFIILLVLIFGIKVTGKVVWVTATLPYFILGIMLFRGVTLPGSRAGLEYLLEPRYEQLLLLDTWSNAAIQVFYSLGAGFGIHLTLSSFNRFQHNLLYDCLITAIVNFLTSILAGFVIFSFLGNLAYSLRKKIKDMEDVTLGIQLLFEVFPQAVGRLPGSNFFSFIFFLLIFSLGIDTIISATQSIQIAVIDNFKDCFQRHAHSQEVFTFILLIVSYLVSVTCVTQGGIYIYQVLEATTASVSLLFAALLQCVALAWVFGTRSLCEAAQAMTGSYPSPFFIICWKFISPAFLTAVLVITIQGTLAYVPEFADKAVPIPYYYLGLGIAIFPAVCVPLYSIYAIIRTKTSSKYKNKLVLALSPEYEHAGILAAGVAPRGKLCHYFELGIVLNKNKRRKSRKPSRESVNSLHINNAGQSNENDNNIENVPA